MKFGLTIHVQSVLLTLLVIFLFMIGGRTMYGLKYGAMQPLVKWVPVKESNKAPVQKDTLSSTENVMDPFYG